MKREIYQCDVTGKDYEKDEIVSFKTETPQPTNNLQWGDGFIEDLQTSVQNRFVRFDKCQ